VFCHYGQDTWEHVGRIVTRAEDKKRWEVGFGRKAMEDLVYRLRKRAEIRRQIPGRKSVQAGEKDRIADLLDESAAEIERLRKEVERLCVLYESDPHRTHVLHEGNCVTCATLGGA
jgi:hypothetical protein